MKKTAQCELYHCSNCGMSIEWNSSVECLYVINPYKKQNEKKYAPEFSSATLSNHPPPRNALVT